MAAEIAEREYAPATKRTFFMFGVDTELKLTVSFHKFNRGSAFVIVISGRMLPGRVPSLRQTPNQSRKLLPDSFVINVRSDDIGAECRQQTILRQAQNDKFGARKDNCPITCC